MRVVIYNRFSLSEEGFSGNTSLSLKPLKLRMSTSDWVGLARNAVCCVMDLIGTLPPLAAVLPFSHISSLLTPVAAYIVPEVVLSAVLKMNFLEALKFPLQAYAVYSLVSGGMEGVRASISALGDVPLWSAAIEKKKRSLQGTDEEGDRDKRRSGRLKTPTKKQQTLDLMFQPSVPCVLGTFKLLKAGLNEHKREQTRKLIESGCCVVIGVCFVWLACHTLHITETGLIGGVSGLILALSFMEVALVPLLCFMLADAVGGSKRWARMRKTVEACYEGDMDFDPSSPNKEVRSLGLEPKLLSAFSPH